MPSPDPVPERRERFLAGDPLRGLAAIGVLVVHASSMAVLVTGYSAQLEDPAVGYPGLYGALGSTLLIGGGLGYFVFFVLSGYLIGGPYVRAAIDGRPAAGVGTFLRNRVLRIVPAYWLVLTALLVILGPILDEARPSAGEIAGLYAFQIQPDNPLAPFYGQVWTLDVEAEFYLWVALAAVIAVPLVRRLRGPRALRAAVIAVPALAWFAIAPFVEMGTAVGEHPFRHYVSLLLVGVAIAAIEPFVRPHVERRRVWNAVGAVALTAGTAYMFALLWLQTSVGGLFATDWSELIAHVAIVGIVGGPLVAQWATGGSWRLIDNPVTRWLGERSYSFYLVHLMVLWAIGQGLAELGEGYKVTLALLLPAGIAVSALSAELSFRLVERPFLRRKRGPVPVPPRAVAEPPRREPLPEPAG